MYTALPPERPLVIKTTPDFKIVEFEIMSN